MLIFAACSSDTALPTLRPTVDAGGTDATVDPNLGSGFDPNLGNDDQPTPTRENASSGGSDAESGARGAGFMAQITGGSVSDITDGGQYGCNTTWHRIASGSSVAPNITFMIPITNATSTHTLAENTAVSIEVALASVDDRYGQVTGGTLTIDRIPADSGEFVSGSFDFTVRNDSGAELGVRGSFDFATGDTVYC